MKQPLFSKRKKLFWIGLLLFSAAVRSQPVPAELMAGHQNLYLQHGFARTISSSHFGVLVTSSLLFPYEKEDRRRSELMSQTYLTWRPVPGIGFGAGTFYATAPGLKPSFNIQFSAKIKAVQLMLVLRTDLKRNPAYDFMAFAEYRSASDNHFRLYARVQTMMNFSAAGHHRGYQYFRLGFEYGILQTGLALNLDAYGPRYSYVPNAGVFFRTLL